MRYSKIFFATLSLLSMLISPLAHAGGPIVTGWFGGRILNYVDQGPANKSFKNGASQIYLIGGNREYQANVLATIQGEPGFNPNWNVNVVHTAPGVVVQDIISAGLASPFFSGQGVVFDNANNIIEAVRRGLDHCHARHCGTLPCGVRQQDAHPRAIQVTDCGIKFLM